MVFLLLLIIQYHDRNELMLSSPSVGELCRWIVRSRELTPFSTIIPILNSPSRQHALPPIYSVVSSSSCPPSLTGTGYTFETDNRDNRIVTFTSQIIGFEFSHTYLASKGRHSDVLHFSVVIMLMQKANYPCVLQEMDKKDFNNFDIKEWHIGVVHSKSHPLICSLCFHSHKD
jgi:hypothetical protein